MTLRQTLFLPYALIGLIGIVIGLYFRLYPLTHNYSSENYEKASLSVVNQLRVLAAVQVNERFPGEPPAVKSRLIKEHFDQLLRQKRKNVQTAIERAAVEMEHQSGMPPRTPYLLESDPFNFYALTENIVRTGAMSGTVKNSKYFNRLMLAPDGRWEPLTLHPYVGFVIYRVLQFFNSSIDLIYAVSLTPLILTALTVIPFLMICYLLGCNAASSFTGLIFFLLSPVFVKRSLFGWYDNDPYNILLPLLILTFFFWLIRAAGLRQKIIFGALCAFFLNIYALFWQGWGYIFCVLLLSAGGILLYTYFILKKSRATKETSFHFSLMFGLTFLLIAVAFGLQDFFVLFQEGFATLKDFVTAPASLWPDLYISVGELRKASFEDIRELTGGFLLLTVALFGFGRSLWNTCHHRSLESASRIITLSVFLLSSVSITLGAQRFALLCLVPLSLFFAAGLQEIFAGLATHLPIQILCRRDTPFLRRGAASLLILILSAAPIYYTNQQLPALVTRIFNQTWEDTLLKIRGQTPPESIINTWWPPGHFIKAIAHRRVTFDGATINVPQAYWMANVFLADDERDALGILRMLNNSANRAVEYLTARGIKLSNAVSLLKEITSLRRDQASDILKDYMPPATVAALLNLTHKEPPPSYLFIYNELVEKNMLLSFVNRWDFKAMEKIASTPELKAEIPPRKSKKYVDFLWGIAGGPLIYSETLNELARQNNTVLFEQGVEINLTDLTCRVSSQKFGRGIPQKIFYADKKNFIEKKLPRGSLGYSVLLIEKAGVPREQTGHYGVILLDERLAKSMLIRLYFFNGKGLKYFKPFTREKDLTGRTEIVVYAVDWKGFEGSPP